MIDIKLHPKGKILLLALALCIACSIVSVETLIAGDIDHTCSEHNCRICIKIETAKNFLKALKLASFFLCIIASFILTFDSLKTRIKLNTHPLSPILLKVRLNS